MYFGSIVVFSDLGFSLVAYFVFFKLGFSDLLEWIPSHSSRGGVAGGGRETGAHAVCSAVGMALLVGNLLWAFCERQPRQCLPT